MARKIFPLSGVGKLMGSLAPLAAPNKSRDGVPRLRPVVRRRICWALLIGLILVALVVLILVFADSYSVKETTERCSPSFAKSKWPLYLGCAMAAHEGLAGGLLGAAGALFAAWLAFDAIQEQFTEERERRKIEQAEAKEAAVLCVTPAIHAAAAALSLINDALKAQGTQMQHADLLVATEVEHVGAQLDSFTVKESLRDLGLDDRLIYLAILGTLSTFVSISTRPSPAMDRIARLRVLRRALMNLHTYLAGFDADLARVFGRDSNTKPTDAVN
jgi:hypothetical protein